jgi:hypothetical protein
LFSRVVVLTCIPSVLEVYEGCFFPTSSPTFVVGGILDDSYSNRGEVEF